MCDDLFNVTFLFVSKVSKFVYYALQYNFLQLRKMLISDEFREQYV